MDEKVEKMLHDCMGDEYFQLTMDMLDIVSTPYNGKVRDRLTRVIEGVVREK